MMVVSAAHSFDVIRPFSDRMHTRTSHGNNIIDCDINLAQAGKGALRSTTSIMKGKR